jgi:hypothetical protein
MRHVADTALPSHSRRRRNPGDIVHFNVHTFSLTIRYDRLNFPRTKIRIRDYNQRGRFPISYRG